MAVFGRGMRMNERDERKGGIGRDRETRRQGDKEKGGWGDGEKGRIGEGENRRRRRMRINSQ
jgi:hypothetical protein